MNLKFAQVLRTLKSSKAQQIPPFADNIMANLQQEIKRLTTQIKDVTKKKSNVDQSQMKFINGKSAAIFDQFYRLKRFALIYLNTRLNKIERQYWDFGGDINHTEKDHLSQKQKEYLIKYKQLTADYMQNVGLDMLTDLQPPIHLEVQFRVLQDCGQVVDQKGQSVNLKKNSGGFMSRRLVESFMKQGKIKIYK